MVQVSVVDPAEAEVAGLVTLLTPFTIVNGAVTVVPWTVCGLVTSIRMVYPAPEGVIPAGIVIGIEPDQVAGVLTVTVPTLTGAAKLPLASER